MITLAIALADKWTKGMTGLAYFAAMLCDTYCVWLIADALKGCGHG